METQTTPPTISCATAAVVTAKARYARNAAIWWQKISELVVRFFTSARAHHRRRSESRFSLFSLSPNASPAWPAPYLISIPPPAWLGRRGARVLPRRVGEPPSAPSPPRPVGLQQAQIFDEPDFYVSILPRQWIVRKSGSARHVGEREADMKGQACFLGASCARRDLLAAIQHAP